jgi:hypothetical protein
MDVFRQARTLWKSFTLKYLILVLQRLEDEGRGQLTYRIYKGGTHNKGKSINRLRVKHEDNLVEISLITSNFKDKYTFDSFAGL